MAIDYVIDYDCIPKQTLTTEGILERLKGRERAAAVIRLFRENGDPRPPSQMGFEFTRTMLDGAEETRVIIVQDMLDQAAELDPLAHHCAGCPANRFDRPFGCIGRVQYPLSSQGEAWLLERLPGIEEPLVWLLLREGVQKLGYDGSAVAPLRASGTYFEERRVRGRDMVEFILSADQVFEMVFLTGHIAPSHAGVLLLLFGAIPRALEADDIVRVMKRDLTAGEIAARFPFIMTPDEADDATVSDLKDFFAALHRAWALDVRLLLDV